MAFTFTQLQRGELIALINCAFVEFINDEAAEGIFTSAYLKILDFITNSVGDPEPAWIWTSSHS